MIDAQGRLFGRINIVDAAGLVVLFVLIPLAYGAYLLFAPQTPTLVQVEPSVLDGPQATHLVVTGTQLRPYLRMVLRDRQQRDTAGIFGFRDSLGGDLAIPALPIGVYDLVLLDEAQPLTILQRALVVLPASPPVGPGVARFVVESDESFNGVHLQVIRDQVTRTCELWQHVSKVKDVPCQFVSAR